MFRIHALLAIIVVFLVSCKNSKDSTPEVSEGNSSDSEGLSGEIEFIQVSQSSCKQLFSTNEMVDEKKYTAIGKIIDGYVPDGGDVWGSAIFVDEKTNKKIPLSYFGMSLYGGDDAKQYECISLSPEYKYKEQRVAIEYTKNIDWESFSIGRLSDQIDTSGITHSIGQVDRIVEITGVLKGYQMGDQATYISILCDDGFTYEFSSGYAYPKSGSGEDLINEKVKLYVRRVEVNMFERCSLVD